MKIVRLIITIGLLIVIFSVLSNSQKSSEILTPQESIQTANPSVHKTQSKVPDAIKFNVGEKITYVIKQFKIKAGQATLEFQGKQSLNGKDVYLIVFTASALNFYDEEKIYADTDTFLPIRVERDLDIWGKEEFIVEDYDAQAGTVKISKTVNGKTTHQTIDKQNVIDNVYCFIYRYRNTGKFVINESSSLNAPTREFDIVLVGQTKLKTADQTFDAYLLESKPSKYKIWLDASERRIPLKINGAVGIANTSLVMVDYQP